MAATLAMSDDNIAVQKSVVK